MIAENPPTENSSAASPPALGPTVEKSASGSIQSVDRALQVMELIGLSGATSVTEIAEQLGVHKSTVSRIISSLEARGFVEPLAGGRGYRIGFTVVRLAGTTNATLDLSKYGQDICDSLAAETGETTNLAILSGDQAINVVEAQGTASVALQTWVGQPSPAHATSSGKALLAGLTDDELRAALPPLLPKFTDYTITDLDTLIDELRVVRERGWAMAVEELEIGLVAIAAPVRDHTGTVVSGLSISGPRYRFEPEQAAQLAATVAAAGETLSARFGFRAAG